MREGEGRSALALRRPRSTHVVLLEEGLGVIVGIDVDLGESVVNGGLLLSSSNLGLEPGKDQLEAVALLDLIHELIDGNGTGDGGEESLDGGLVAVDVEKTSNDLGRARRVDTLDVDLDEVGEAVLVQVEDEVVDKVEAVANDDEGELVGELGLLEEVLDLLGVVKVALANDALDLADLTGPRGGLDVLEVNLRVLAEVDDRAEVVVESCR